MWDSAPGREGQVWVPDCAHKFEVLPRPSAYGFIYRRCTQCQQLQRLSITETWVDVKE